MDTKEIANYKEAGEIAKQVVAYAKGIIKPNMLLLEIAEKIHGKIEYLGAIPAFPVNLAINDIAAHYHPILEDETKAQGLLKVDIGVHVDGYIADTAFSLDLTPNKKYKPLIEASEQALENALKKLEKNPDLTLNEIGSKNKLKEGAYAIEPFATTGEGKIYEGGSSNIFRIENPKNPRSPNARKILNYVYKKYKTLPFSLREIQEKFPGARIALKELEQQGIIKNYSQLIENSHGPVSQAEHT